MKKRHPHKTNILLVNITRLGDMLQATPTIAGMKRENPDAKVTVLVEKQFEDVCHHLPNIDHVVALDLGMTVRSLAREGDGIIDAYEYISETVDQLREKQFDYCLNMSSSAYTALLLRLIGISRNGGWTSDEEGYRIIESDWARLFATSVFHQNRQFNSLNLVDVFRCSADVDQHPHQLLMNVSPESLAHVDGLIRDAQFTNTGPLIAVQAGASQEKRQWATRHFAKLIKILVERANARVVLIGSHKELPIVEPIKAACESPNVAVCAGKTSVPQLAALLKRSQILVTGDTGPMHMAVAVGIPVVSMFLGSAYGYETGPYSEGNLVLQPVIGCGPCNPNKPCTTVECHDHIPPEVVAELALMRMAGDVRRVPEDLVDPRKVIVYRTTFDQHGFYDLEALSSPRFEKWGKYREAYRRLWLDDLGDLSAAPATTGAPSRGREDALRVVSGEDRDGFAALPQVAALARQGLGNIQQLQTLIMDPRSASGALGAVNQTLGEIDRRIEQLGYSHPPLGPLSRMFIFAKENMQGSEATDLASQMGRIYGDLERRAGKLAGYYVAG